jgi:hypothetical protein
MGIKRRNCRAMRAKNRGTVAGKVRVHRHRTDAYFQKMLVQKMLVEPCSILLLPPGMINLPRKQLGGRNLPDLSVFREISREASNRKIAI